MGKPTSERNGSCCLILGYNWDTWMLFIFQYVVNINGDIILLILFCQRLSENQVTNALVLFMC